MLRKITSIGNFVLRQMYFQQKYFGYRYNTLIPDPANSFGSDRFLIRIWVHSNDRLLEVLLCFSPSTYVPYGTFSC